MISNTASYSFFPIDRKWIPLEKSISRRSLAIRSRKSFKLFTKMVTLSCIENSQLLLTARTLRQSRWFVHFAIPKPPRTGRHSNRHSSCKTPHPRFFCPVQSNECSYQAGNIQNRFLGVWECASHAILANVHDQFSPICLPLRESNATLSGTVLLTLLNALRDYTTVLRSQSSSCTTPLASGYLIEQNAE